MLCQRIVSGYFFSQTQWWIVQGKFTDRQGIDLTAICVQHRLALVFSYNSVKPLGGAVSLSADDSLILNTLLSTGGAHRPRCNSQINMFHYFETRRAEQGNMVFIKVHGEDVRCQIIEESLLMPQRDMSVCLQTDRAPLFSCFFFHCTHTYAPHPLFHSGNSVAPPAGQDWHSPFSEASVISSRIPFMLCSHPADNQMFSFTQIFSVCLTLSRAKNTHPLSLSFLHVMKHMFLSVGNQFEAANPSLVLLLFSMSLCLLMLTKDAIQSSSEGPLVVKMARNGKTLQQQATKRNVPELSSGRWFIAPVAPSSVTQEIFSHFCSSHTVLCRNARVLVTEDRELLDLWIRSPQTDKVNKLFKLCSVHQIESDLVFFTVQCMRCCRACRPATLWKGLLSPVCLWRGCFLQVTSLTFQFNKPEVYFLKALLCYGCFKRESEREREREREMKNVFSVQHYNLALLPKSQNTSSITVTFLTKW